MISFEEGKDRLHEKKQGFVVVLPGALPFPADKREQVFEFFRRLAFKVVDKATLPHKVWNECIRCPKFVGCTEIAVVRELAPGPVGPMQLSGMDLPVFR